MNSRGETLFLSRIIAHKRALSDLSAGALRHNLPAAAASGIPREISLSAGELARRQHRGHAVRAHRACTLRRGQAALGQAAVMGDAAGALAGLVPGARFCPAMPHAVSSPPRFLPVKYR
jgi:hypothetical protein